MTLDSKGNNHRGTNISIVQVPQPTALTSHVLAPMVQLPNITISIVKTLNKPIILQAMEEKFGLQVLAASND